MKRETYLILIAIVLAVMVIPGVIVIALENTAFKPYPASKYESLLRQLLDSGYTFILPRDYQDNMTKVAVLTHDIDGFPNGVNTFAAVEEKFHVRSLMNVRPGGEYFDAWLPRFRQLESDGWEIGFHYDSYSRTKGISTLATFAADWTKMLRNFSNLDTISSHGADQNYNNFYWLRDTFKTQENLTSWFSVRELNWMQFDTIVSDAHKVWVQPEHLGSRIWVILHSDYW